MNEQRGLDNYASPILRAAVFRRLNPDAHISYTIVPIAEAFPDGHREYEGKATQAVRCEIVWPDGRWVVAHKEMDLFERGRPVTQTPEQLVKDETKALGRALRDCGIPQRLTELKLLMQWVNAGGSVSVTNVGGNPASRVTLREEFPVDGDDGGDVENDSPDAGSEPTAEQLLAERFSRLNGADKAAVSRHAATLGVKNIMRAGDQTETLMAYIESHAWLKEEPAAEPPAPPEPPKAALGSKAKRGPAPDEEPF